MDDENEAVKQVLWSLERENERDKPPFERVRLPENAAEERAKRREKPPVKSNRGWKVITFGGLAVVGIGGALVVLRAVMRRKSKLL
jgi:hypothetical protein